MQRNRTLTLLLVLLAALPALAFGAQRLGGRAQQRGFGGAGVEPSQIWRVPTLTLSQRQQLRDLQASVMRELRDARDGSGAGRPARGELMGRRQQLMAEVERIVGPANIERAKAMPRGPLSPEEILYYPIMSLPDLDAAKRAKVEAMFKPLLASKGDARAGDPREGKDRQRRIALFEVLDALLTTDQMVAVKAFLPENLRNVGLRERVVYRLPSLTLDQEARAKAIFAALEDETGADRARMKAIANELKGGDAKNGDALRKERREIAERLDAREKTAYADLSKVLSPEQMKQLAAMPPGPARPVAFTPENVRALGLSADQQKRVREAFQRFQQETRDERGEAKELRDKVKGSDFESMEMAETRDQLRRVATVLDTERDRLVRTIADTLTGDQLARLVLDETHE